MNSANLIVHFRSLLEVVREYTANDAESVYLEREAALPYYFIFCGESNGQLVSGGST